MSGPTILDRIADTRRARIKQEKGIVTLAAQRLRAEERGPCPDVAPGISDRLLALDGSKRAIIAEIKRRSPSKGELAPNLDPAKLSASYERAGAFAISCLVEPDYFGGGLDDLDAVCAAVTIPVLYKDFVVDPYQLWQARAHGAELVLLIVALLGRELKSYVEVAAQAGITPLVEVHNREELELAFDSGASIIGVNNRNLKTFEVDLGISERLMPLYPKGIAAIAESGIRNVSDMDRLANAGANGFLIGETIVTAEDPEAALRKLVDR